MRNDEFSDAFYCLLLHFFFSFDKERTQKKGKRRKATTGNLEEKLSQVTEICVGLILKRQDMSEQGQRERRKFYRVIEPGTN